MKLTRVCVGLAALACEPASAQLMSSSQSFYVTYQSHGSTGPQEIGLYDGPDILRAVKITWHGDVGSYFDDYYGDDTPYVQAYSGSIGFYMYNEDDHSPVNGASSFKSFSGSTPCTYSECEIFGSASGILFASPDQFQGSGTLIIDSGSYIVPNFGFGGDFGSGSDLYGTITYYYGTVPEPGSWTLMLGGFGLMGGAFRLRGQPRGQTAH
jgi:hypothetical protein